MVIMMNKITFKDCINSIIVLIGIALFVMYLKNFYTQTSDFPQCRLSRDPYLCAELLKKRK